MDKTLENAVKDLEFRMQVQEQHWLETENKYKILALGLETNTAITQQVNENIKIIGEFITVSRGAVRFFAVLANLSRFVLVVGSALLFLWFFFKGKPGTPSINLLGNE